MWFVWLRLNLCVSSSVIVFFPDARTFPVYLYEALQPAGHHQRVLTALQGAFQLLPLQADAIKRHENLHGPTRVGCGQMLCLFLHHQTETALWWMQPFMRHNTTYVWNHHIHVFVSFVVHHARWYFKNSSFIYRNKSPQGFCLSPCLMDSNLSLTFLQ